MTSANLISPVELLIVSAVAVLAVVVYAVIRRIALDRAQRETEKQLRDIVVTDEEPPELPIGGF